ncbi:uncharacterized protein H6S33_009984 [Morchella sextelata]|uniref:uncharacterized protein n=1 Tax=Morchella sextelata TaxID=1174677 RepID=UPI001D049861|nr:uncharacterized protein H6S33_009984 [Morchella sextelata]KAH0611932.1 hypothetical protein H6S33_009984 [Morchella sextelata]
MDISGISGQAGTICIPEAPEQPEVRYSPEELQSWDLLAETLVYPSKEPQEHPIACNGKCKGDLSGPHTCTRDNKRRLAITCRSDNCAAKFTNKCAFNRHCRSVHGLGELVDCGFAGCNRVGSEGFLWRDNMLQHMREKHGAEQSDWRFVLRGPERGFEMIRRDV